MSTEAAMEATRGLRAQFVLPKWMEAAILICAATLFFIVALVPAWRTLNTDFPNYYVAATLFSAGVPLDRAYEWEWFQRQKDHLRVPQSLVGFAPHPPLCALPVAPLTTLSPLTAKRVWIVFNVALLIATMMLVARATNLRLWQTSMLFCVLLVPLRSNFMLGQYYVLILWLISLAYYFQQHDRRFLSGVALAVAASLKIFPALFLLLFFWKRNWKSALGLVAGLVALAGLSILLFGFDVHRVYLTEVLPRALSGDLLGPYVPRSYIGLWHRLFVYEPELNAMPLFSSPLYYAMLRIAAPLLLTACFLFSVKEGKADNPAIEWSAMLFLVMLLSSMPASYHYCVLVLGVTLAIGWLREQRRFIPVAVLIAITVCTFAPRVPDIARLLLLTLLFALLLHYGMSSTSDPRRWLKVSLATLILLAVSAAFAFRTGIRPEDRHSLLIPGSNGYRAANPVASAHAIAFTQMVNTGYRAAFLSGNQFIWLSQKSDVLSLTASSRSSWIYYEVADARSSIWRISTDAPGSAEYVTQGQQPYLSHNAEWLIFIHEWRGIGHLWLRSTSASTERQLTFGNLNVLEATVNDTGEVIASIGPAGNPTLISIASTGSVRPLAWSRNDRFPSYSPDGSRLAFSRREHGALQVRVRDLMSGNEQQLTHGTCNSIQPAWALGNLLYATDCRRGLGLSAIAQVPIP